MMNRERNATDSRWTGPAGAQEAQGPLPFPSQRPRKHRPGATRSPGARPGEPGGHGASAAHLAWAARVPPGRVPTSRELGSLTRTAGQETRASHLGGRGGPPAAPTHYGSCTPVSSTSLFTFTSSRSIPGSPALPGVLGASQSLGAPT